MSERSCCCSGSSGAAAALSRVPRQRRRVVRRGGSLAVVLLLAAAAAATLSQAAAAAAAAAAKGGDDERQMLIGWMPCEGDSRLHRELSASLRRLVAALARTPGVATQELTYDYDDRAALAKLEPPPPGFEPIDEMDAVLACGEPGLDVHDFVEAAGVRFVKLAPDSDDPTWRHAPVYEWPQVVLMPAGEQQQARTKADLPPAYGGDAADIDVLQLPSDENDGDDAFAQTADALLAALRRPRAQPTCGAGFEGFVNKPPAELALNMIVKNEEASMATLLRSVKDEIDYWAILDTGSNDSTPDVIQEEMRGVPGVLGHAGFVDFSVTRNEGLRLLNTRAGNGSVVQGAAFAFVMDGDHVMTGMWRLRRAARRLGAACRRVSYYPVCNIGVDLQRVYGGASLWWTRMWQTYNTGTYRGWRFMYPVHEYPEHTLMPYWGDRLMYRYATQVTLYGNVSNHEKSVRRWRDFDLPILEKARARKPDDARVAFYYAQTLDCLDRVDEAIAAYARRAEMLNGFWEERFMSWLRMGRALARHGKDPSEPCLRALQYNPTRAEPAYVIAEWHDQMFQGKKCEGGGNYSSACVVAHRLLAYHYAKVAASKPRSGVNGVLFIDDEVYARKAKDLVAIHAWHMAHEVRDIWGEGQRYAFELAERWPDNARYKSNADWFSHPAPYACGLPECRKAAKEGKLGPRAAAALGDDDGEEGGKEAGKAGGKAGGEAGDKAAAAA